MRWSNATFTKEVGANVQIGDTIKNAQGEVWEVASIEARKIFRDSLLQRFRNWLIRWNQPHGTYEVAYYYATLKEAQK
jgi:hypothetical protein